MRRQPRCDGLASLVGLLAALLCHAPSFAAEPGADLTVSVLTFGPGEHPFLKFGHNAILIEAATEPGWVFNFGTFDFADPALVTKFLRGRFHYWLSVGGVQATYEAYIGENRTVVKQELDLTTAEKWALWQALRENAKPENRAYLYDYFFDNCSTRVRDAIDRVVQGRIRAAGRAPAVLTLRADALRMTADFFPEYLGIYLGLSRLADRPIDRWTEAFLPERLTELLRTVKVPDGTGEKNLVKSERVIYQSTRPPKPATPPRWCGYFLAAGLALGSLLLVLGRLGRRLALARVLLGLASSALGLLAGILGLVLVGFWAFTNHKIAYANANILQLAPWTIAWVVYGVGVAMGRPSFIRGTSLLTLLSVVASAAGLLCKIFPGQNQDNWPFVVFCLPVWVGLWLGGRSLEKAQS